MKKFSLGILASLAGLLPLAAFAQDAGSTTTIAMPPGFAADVVANAGAFFTSWEGFVVIIAGTLLGAVVIEILIGAFKK